MPSRRGTSGGLCEREQAVTAVVFVVVVNDGVDVNGCVASASTPVVHVLPGQGLRQPRQRGLPPGTAAASEQPQGLE